MKVLVIGSGGREHAITHAISKSKLVDKIYIAPGNDGINEAECINISATDNEALLNFAIKNNIDLTIVGPEVSLSNGIVNLFKENNLKIFGPSKEAARIESSKEYAKELMKKYQIPTAKYETFSNYDEAVNYVKKEGAPIVIKFDGLAAGKGVSVCNSVDEAINALKDMLLNKIFGEGKVIIEEYLSGVEFSFMCFVDNENVYPLALSQDHKRAFDNDKGNNTGGMGAYSPLPFITEKDKEYALNNIMKKTALALKEDNAPFTGVLYGGLMKCNDGIKVIEFNCRFGDPETEVVLPRLTSDLYQAINDLLDHKEPILTWSNQVTLGIVMASCGYPSSYIKHYLIENLDHVNGKIYYMGVKKEDDKIYTNGGRVLIVTATGSTVKEAHDNCLNEVKKIKCDNLFYRSDIGHIGMEEEK